MSRELFAVMVTVGVLANLATLLFVWPGPELARALVRVIRPRRP